MIKHQDIDWPSLAAVLGVVPAGIDAAAPIVPTNLPAEQGLLGAILVNNAAYDRVVGFLRSEHFADPIHGRIFQAIARRIEAGQLADAVTLKTEFEHAGVLDEVGGTAYLAQLLTAMVGILHAGEYGRTIHDTWLRRRAMLTGLEIVQAAMAPGPDRPYREAVGDGVNAMLDVQADAASADRSRVGTLGAAAAAVLAAADREHRADPTQGTGLYTGIETLDAVWRGMWPGRMTLLAGRSGHGKTALATQIMRSAAATLAGAASAAGGGKPGRVLLYSLEMSRDDIAARMLSWETGIPSDDIVAGRLTGDRAFSLVEAQRVLDALPIDIHDATSMTVQEIVGDATAAVRRSGVRLIVIDHLHRIAPPAGRRIDPSQAVPAAAKALKDLARALGVHVLLLAQIAARTADRGGGDDYRPRVSQIGYGGDTEADDVVLVWREELHMGREPPEVKGNAAAQAAARAAWVAKLDVVRDRVEAILPKRRFGPVGAVMMRFDGRRGKFSDLPVDPALGALPGLWDEIPPPWGEER